MMVVGTGCAVAVGWSTLEMVASMRVEKVVAAVGIKL